MGIIDDHYGGYENLALYSDGHGGFGMEAAYGATFESTIDARIQAVCGGTFPIGSLMTSASLMTPRTMDLMKMT